ncbi:MAG: Gx transporter family protein [Butyricicoccus sp.]
MKNAKRLTLCGMLAAVAVVLSLVERMFPLDAIVPVPGVKLGLANVVTVALTRLGERRIAIVVTRCHFSLLMGSVSAFLFRCSAV